jgi:hypothetical protein
VGVCGVELTPLAEAMKADLLKRAVLHADETPVSMLKPGLGHTHKPISGATAARSSMHRHWWCTTSPRVAAVILEMLRPSEASYTCVILQPGGPILASGARIGGLDPEVNVRKALAFARLANEKGLISPWHRNIFRLGPP